MPDASCDIGLIGLAVMGQNLVLNMNDHGFKVAVFNRTVSKVDDFLANEAKGTQVAGAHSIEEFARPAEAPAPRDAHGQGRRHRRPDDRPRASLP
jgi:6-phosphogluconate dehydrogenase